MGKALGALKIERIFTFEHEDLTGNLTGGFDQKVNECSQRPPIGPKGSKLCMGGPEGSIYPYLRVRPWLKVILSACEAKTGPNFLKFAFYWNNWNYFVRDPNNHSKAKAKFHFGRFRKSSIKMTKSNGETILID